MFQIRMMTIDDYDTVIQLMKDTPGISIRDADSRDGTLRYLQRNPGLSLVAEVEGQIVGCLMAGHDGRRGYLQHLIVAPAQRRHGIATALVQHSLRELEQLNIRKFHVDVLKTNASAVRFWIHQGWTLRTDIDRYSKSQDSTPNA